MPKDPITAGTAADGFRFLEKRAQGVPLLWIVYGETERRWETGMSGSVEDMALMLATIHHEMWTRLPAGTHPDEFARMAHRHIRRLFEVEEGR